jgi:hypothetical protein
LINFSIASLKYHEKVNEINPYFKEERFKKYKLDRVEIIENNTDNPETLKFKHTWGAKKISRFIRCYVSV